MAKVFVTRTYDATISFELELKDDHGMTPDELGEYISDITRGASVRFEVNMHDDSIDESGVLTLNNFCLDDVYCSDWADITIAEEV